MAAVSSVQNSATSNLLQSSSAQATSLGKEDFLTLLIAQLQNQDPLNPADATEFTSQLAQFSQLEQLNNVNDKLEKLAGMSDQVERQSALGMIGDQVVVEGSNFRADGQAQTLGYRLATEAAEVDLHIFDSLGNPVAHLPSDQTTLGEYFLSWDGKNSSGQPVEPGEYELVVRAVDDEDHLLEATSLLRTRVTGVDMANSTTALLTAAGSFDMGNLVRVDTADTVAASSASGAAVTAPAGSNADLLAQVSAALNSNTP